MIFDSLREITSNWLTDIKRIVDAATLIHIPVTPHHVLPREQDLEGISSAAINFRLPHRITAVEDNASCVVLADPKPGLVGLVERRMFIDCIPLDTDESCYNDTARERAWCEEVKKSGVRGIHLVSVGFISSPAQRAGSYVAAGEVLWVVKGTVTTQLTTIAQFNALPASTIAMVTDGETRNAMTAIEELILLRRQAILRRR